MDAHSRREAGLAAIDQVLNGALASACETEIVDFKEERGTVLSSGRVAIDARHEPAAKALAEAVACFSNGDQGGLLIVGVADDRSGMDAFVGSHLNTGWLRDRIFALTQPHVSVDVIEEYVVHGTRVYFINVTPAMEEIRVGGRLRARVGTNCEELDGNRAREFLERRRRFDWSEEASGFHLADAVPEALSSAHDKYIQRHGSAAGSDAALVRRLGVALGSGADPELSRAGALLLCRFEPGSPKLDVLVTTAEGVTSEARVLQSAPIILAFDEAWAMLSRAFPARDVVVGAQRRSVRPVPELAIREALVNALMHRDYDQERGYVVATATGDPSRALKVQSPGAFPPGVERRRLLATRSQPRNPALAEAFRTLGLADREGVGIDSMYRVMLRDGHPEPDIDDPSGDVVCRLTGGQVDARVRSFFDELLASDRSLGEDTRVYIAVTELLQRTPLRPGRLAELAQTSEAEAMELLGRLSAIGVLDRLLDSSKSFRLSARSREQLRTRLQYKIRQTVEEQWDLVRAFLDVEPAIGREDAARLLDVTPERASTILGVFVKQLGRLEPVANARGRGVRYRLVRNVDDGPPT